MDRDAGRGRRGVGRDREAGDERGGESGKGLVGESSVTDGDREKAGVR